MSAVAVAVWDEGVIVAGDGVCSDPDTGEVGGLFSKVITLPERNAIVAWCGIGTFGHRLNLAIAQQYPTFDELLDAFPEICEGVHTDFVDEFGLYWAPTVQLECSVVLAGYSTSRRRHEAYRLVSYVKESTNGVTGEKSFLEPWKLIPISYLYCSHAPRPELLKEFGLETVDGPVDLAGLCIRFICANRAESGQTNKDDPLNAGRFYSVGGFVQMAYMQGDTIQSWIAHRWPEDVPGQRIDPSKGERLPAYLMSAEAPRQLDEGAPA